MSKERDAIVNAIKQYEFTNSIELSEIRIKRDEFGDIETFFSGEFVSRRSVNGKLV